MAFIVAKIAYFLSEFMFYLFFLHIFIIISYDFLKFSKKIAKGNHAKIIKIEYISNIINGRCKKSLKNQLIFTS